MKVLVNGRCHCGRICYKAYVNPKKTRICHCKDCQHLSGSAFRVNLPVAKNDFELCSGTLKSYIKVAQSGNQREQCFCPDCGTQIYATSVSKESEQVYNLRVGSIDNNHEFPPLYQQWSCSAQSWLQHIADLPSYVEASN
ncbi:GFA family protein [Aliikangiella sp. IMCC44359]|uniref:GFA family protein n=1 Tax=Aliikangiella sp. IMCC44359 TaxID=3459125 RepID=UPI00403A7D08